MQSTVCDYKLCKLLSGLIIAKESDIIRVPNKQNQAKLT